METYDFWDNVLTFINYGIVEHKTKQCECGGLMGAKRVNTKTGMDELYLCSECPRAEDMKFNGD